MWSLDLWDSTACSRDSFTFLLLHLQLHPSYVVFLAGQLVTGLVERDLL
jgi:hypothetical protein